MVGPVRYDAEVMYSFTAPIWYWRGPSPFYFVTVPAEISEELRELSTAATSEELRELSTAATYGWGMIPVEVDCGGVGFTTSLFAKDGGYVMPVKKAVRTAVGLDQGDVMDVAFSVSFRTEG